MKKLEALVAALENKIPRQAMVNENISKASVGWHIEHSLLTLNVVAEALRKSNPSAYNRKFSLNRIMLVALGKIPRGRIKSPPPVRPTIAFTDATLREHILLTRKNLEALRSLEKDHFFKHPFLGDFKLQPAIRFLRIHTNHHLGIINDIISSKDNGEHKG